MRSAASALDRSNAPPSVLAVRRLPRPAKLPSCHLLDRVMPPDCLIPGRYGRSPRIAAVGRLRSQYSPIIFLGMFTPQRRYPPRRQCWNSNEFLQRSFVKVLLRPVRHSDNRKVMCLRYGFDCRSLSLSRVYDA